MDKIILGKPSGISLASHNSNVMQQLLYYLSNKNFVLNKYQKYFKDVDLVNELIKTALLHDEGKKHPRWQTACQNDYILWKEKKPLKNLLTANFRHEIQSCLNHFDDISFEQLIAIVAHHGKLKEGINAQDKFLNVENAESIIDTKLYKKLLKSNHKIKDLEYENIILNSYKVNAQRSILQLCDRKASYFENSGKKYEKELSLNNFSYKFPINWKLRKIQQIAKDNALKHDLLIIKAKTGGGKTAGGLLWADKHITSGNADRLIICLPTIFTTLAMERSINDSVGCDISKAYSSSTKFKLNKNEDDLYKQYFYFDLIQRRTFQYPITITTIDHILNAIVQQSEESHTANFNLANSCIIIDEADFYDDLVMANIKELLRYTQPLKIKTLLMSATFPTSYRKFFADIHPDYNVSQVLEDDSGIMRKRYYIDTIENYNVDALFLSKKIINNIKKAKKTIVFCNTIASSLRMKRCLEQVFNPETIILYNSNFIAPDKNKKQEEILDNFGENPKDNYSIAILTQVGEMSLNISSDYMLTDICPIDRLEQRFGRVGRYDKNDEIRKVSILIPTKNDAVYPPPYGELSPDKKSWILSDALINTIDQLKIGKYSIKELNQINDNVYINGINLKRDAVRNVEIYKTNIKNNWLFVPDNSVELDESELGDNTEWKRRRFLSMVDVFVHPLEKEKYDKSHFNYIFTHNTVRIHTYLMKSYIDNNVLNEKTIIIEHEFYDDRELIVYELVDDSQYDYENGLDINL